MNATTFKHILVAATAISLLVTGCRKPATDQAATVDTMAASSTQHALAALPVRPEDAGAHYNRDEWGGWDTHSGSCSTRALVLQRQGSKVNTAKGCRITGGTWTSPYDGAVIRDPAGVQIDHRVPVKESVRSGARNWTRDQRERFYNDPANLVAVSAKSNPARATATPAAGHHSTGLPGVTTPPATSPPKPPTACPSTPANGTPWPPCSTPAPDQHHPLWRTES